MEDDNNTASKLMNDDIKEILDKLKDGNWYNELDLTGTMWIELRWEETHLLLDYITNLQQKYDKALEDSVKESHKRMELENTLHKIMVSDGEKTTPVLDLIKENERLKNIISSVKEDFLNANNELTNLQQENSKLELENQQNIEMLNDIIKEQDMKLNDLQQENERLKELDENYPIEEELAEAYRREEDYKSRIEKAVEYIEKEKSNYMRSCDISNATNREGLIISSAVRTCDDTLKILNGRSDE